MEKVELRTADIAAENAAKLAELFPDIVTEVLDEDGSVRHSIDVEALKAHVGDVAEDKRERYQFTWPGKQKARAEAIRAIDKTMRPCPEESVNWDTTENLYIEGDNLDALKILRETYAGKIKMIYIDPPYNTGHDFVYNDTFARTAEEERAESGAFDEEGNVLDAAYKVNNESNGKFHSDWCSMMYPRLVLARDLLSEDGVIFISIGDEELINMTEISNYVFGESNRLGIVPRIAKKGSNKGTYFRPTKDYVLVYASTKSNCAPFSIPVDGNVNYKYIETDGSRKGEKYRKGHSLFQASLDSRPNQRYLIEAPDGTLIIPPGRVFPDEKHDAAYVIPRSNADKVWRWSWNSYLEKKEMGILLFERSVQSPLLDENGLPTTWNVYEKKYESDEACKRALPDDVIEGYLNSRATVELGGLNIPFSFSKPVDLIQYLVDLVLTEGVNEDSIVLDFFSGSASTAHAVMQLNAEDGGNRKFIMVQLPEVCDEKSEAAKAGYKNICEIGKERIRRAGAKIAAEVEEANAQLKLGEEPRRVPDIGFRVLKIDSSNFEDVARMPDTLFQDALFSLADNVKPSRTPEDILFQLFPKLEIPYTARIDSFDICGKTVYSVDDDTLVACFDREVSEDVVRAMAQREPAWAVLRDASFTGDDALANFEEIFKTVSPETKTRVV